MSSRKKRSSPVRSSESVKPSSNGVAHPVPPKPPSPEVLDKPTRRRFTADYKARIVKLAETLPRGEQAALLRREGLYASHLKNWRKLYNHGGVDALKAKKPGPVPKSDIRYKKKSEQLEREIARLRHRLDQAQKIIEIQKKVAEILDAEDRENLL